MVSFRTDTIVWYFHSFCTAQQNSHNLGEEEEDQKLEKIFECLSSQKYSHGIRRSHSDGKFPKLKLSNKNSSKFVYIFELIFLPFRFDKKFRQLESSFNLTIFFPFLLLIQTVKEKLVKVCLHFQLLFLSLSF